MAPLLGSHVKRVEDPRLLRGESRYVDDLGLPGMLHLVFVRSAYAHARLAKVDVDAAREGAGVAAVLTGADVAELGEKPVAVAPPGLAVPPHPVLALDAVRYVGQPIVAVVADDRYRARDAADLVAITYDPLPAATEPAEALAPEAARVHPGLDSNLAFEHRWTHGDVDGAFARATRVVRGRFVNQRVAPLPMEPRGCLAQYAGGQLTVWISTQMAHRVKADLGQVLGMPEHRIRVITPEVGGGFGCKAGLYDDEVATVVAAVRLGRPVKWIETRSESLVATIHGRGQGHEAELAVDADGIFLGIRVTGLADLGAYPETFTPLPPLTSGRLVTGAYRIPAASYLTRGVYTNKTPTGPYRGAGRPEASYLIERLADRAAAELGLDPAEIRRRNFIRPEEFPYTVPSGLVYDTGRYGLALDRALEMADYSRFRTEQARLRNEGRHVGLGLSTFVETAGTGPSRMLAFQGWEYGAVRVEPTGRVTVVTGMSPHGQGHETTFAQIVADELGVGLEDVSVLWGDTAVVPAGFGTGGSRGACVGGTAVYLAARAVREKARRIAAHILEAAVDDVTFDDGRLHVRGVPGRGIAFREVAREAHRAARLPVGMEPGLEGTVAWDPPNFTFPFGVYVSIVEVIPETGEIRLLRFIGVDDVGNVLSPLLLEGQLHGGIAQGIAQALWEEVVYDEAGQCLTGTLMDYAAPKAGDLLAFELDRTVTPTPVNPLGAKGVGEAGAVGAPAAIVNAVLDALAPLGVESLDTPLRPEKIWRVLRR
jgi:carbon-monoxide dehydrogenase large subunit